MATRALTLPQRSLRIAFVTPEPVPGGGVPGMAVMVARGLARLGHEVDCWMVPEAERDLSWADVEGLRLRPVEGGFRTGRWYTRRRVPAIARSLLQLGLRGAATRTMARQIVAEHRARPYDVLYRFSTIELLGFRRHLAHLPPLVVHPEVHAAGELRWTKAERDLMQQCHSIPQRATMRWVHTVRSHRQRRDLRHATKVVAPSRRFAQLLAADYRLPADRFTVVPNPVDLDRFRPPARSAGGGPVRVTYVGRAAVRKGIDLVVDLSHRLDDLAGAVELHVVASHSLWCDYRPLLAGANPRLVTVHPAMSNSAVAELLAASDLLVQPSYYEPFAISVAESLASGTPVVASDEVGATEELPTTCATVVPAGNGEALEQAVRLWVSEVQRGAVGPARGAARAEAEARFAPAIVCAALADALADAALGTGTLAAR
jgi:glycosyltransferase involved in cell wall biosynthesis